MPRSAAPPNGCACETTSPGRAKHELEEDVLMTADVLSRPDVATEPCFLTASIAAASIRARHLSCEELLRSCLKRIERRDGDIRAWLHIEPEQALRAARENDKTPARHALHGLPWGVKDVYDTIDLPTTQNSAIYSATQAGRDAACVATVRHCGGLILGKTDTVEFAANGRKALTRNPHDLSRTPGGSSSGSAAAVADFHVPLAFGSQTIGSHLRPASFTGIYAFKPSWGAISREGLKMNAASMDTVGWYGRSVPDLRLAASAFSFLAEDTPPARTIRGLRVGLCRTPSWSKIEPAGEATLMAAAARLAGAGAIVEDLNLPAAFEDLFQAYLDIYYSEGGRAFQPELLASPALLAAPLREQAENRRSLDKTRLREAYGVADRCRLLFDDLFGPDLDVVLTPSAPGEAPVGLENTGSSVFNGYWTILHAPCVGIPAGRAPGGMPVGISLVGRRFDDMALLALAELLSPAIDEQDGLGGRIAD